MGTCTGTGAGTFASNKVTATIGGVLAQADLRATRQVTSTVPPGAVTTATTGAPKVVLLHDGVAGAPSTVAKFAAVIGGIDKPVGPVTPVNGSSIVISGKGFSGTGALSSFTFGDKAATCKATCGPGGGRHQGHLRIPAQDAAFKGGAVTVSFAPADSAVYGATSKADLHLLRPGLVTPVQRAPRSSSRRAGALGRSRLPCSR